MSPPRAPLAFVVLGCLLPFAASAEATPATIYRCEIGETITFSDRPCDAGAQRYLPDTSRVSTYSPPVSAPKRPVTRSPDRPRKQGGSIAAEQAKHAADCEQLRGTLKEIRSKMRAGYRTKEGERLRERQAKVQERLRAARC